MAGRTTEELKIASKHVHYEISMLAWTAQRLADPLLSQNEINAFLESFTVHARALLFFFFAPPPRTHPNDVLAQHFMPPAVSWKNLAGSTPTALAKVAERVGMEIAHISYGRLTVTPEAKDWKVDEIATELLRLAKTFAENGDHLDPVWPKKPSSPMMDVSSLAGSPSATNEVISSGTTPVAQPLTSVNTPSVQTLIINTSGDFSPKDAD